jgi:hypothetical protein
VGTAIIPHDVMLFCSVLFNDNAPVDKVLSSLKRAYGEFVYKSETMPFDFTSYYEDELGSPLYRILVAFDTLIPRESMPEVKIMTNKIELDLMRGDKRTVNLDPGILTLENVNLATTKPYSHRIYLKDGIWAEVTLIYTKNSYQPLEWTYPDYASEGLVRIFHELREIYKGRRRCQKV